MRKCILCGLNGKLLHIKYGISFFKCKNCGFVYRSPLPLVTPNINNKASYQAYRGSEDILREVKWRLALISKFKNKGKLIDIGCGIGSFPQTAKNAGWEAYGTEVSEWACNYIRERFDFKLFKGTLQEIHFPDKFFDLITLWHVLEHIPDPVEELKEVYRILKDDGVVCIEVPNICSLDALIRGRNWECFVSDHYYYFSKHTLELACSFAGLKLTFAKRISGYESRKHLHSWLKKIVHYILTRLNMGNRLLCIFEKSIDHQIYEK